MAYFSNTNLKNKWVPRFAPNDTGEIDEPDLQEFTTDMVDSFVNKNDVPVGDAVALYSESFPKAATLTLKYNPTALTPYSPNGIFKIRVYAPDGTYKPIYTIAGKVITITQPTNWTKAEVDYWVGSPTSNNPGGEVGIPAEDQDYTPADPTWWGLTNGTLKIQIRLAFDWLATKIKSAISDFQLADTATNNRITLLQAGLTWRGSWYDGMVIKSNDFVYHNQVLWQSNRSTDFTSNAEPSDANTYFKRAFAQSTSFSAASVAEVNAGTETTKAITPYTLANSAYIRFTTLLSGYTKAATNRALAVTDSLMTAIGVLEKKADDNAEGITTLNAITGVLSNLVTTAKTNLVAAVNELYNLIVGAYELPFQLDLNPDVNTTSGLIAIKGKIVSLTVDPINGFDATTIAATSYTYEYKLNFAATWSSAATVAALQTAIATTSDTQVMLVRVINTATTVPNSCLITVKKR
ncbi:hypothetical protein HUW51_17050 [Adhaeribacter swui]|uniref:Uncharacterized protein n=1 Tax=Adhaeribacter swui TaxID=2086471 RepID=A0A7G7GB12_9BACT|nr:hypothetical protein [Adhaeribacter swui]QNF34346.1 hypothetical protein HUW51_17050 [Adhaeribacter swui]